MSRDLGRSEKCPPTLIEEMQMNNRVENPFVNKYVKAFIVISVGFTIINMMTMYLELFQ